MSVATSVMDLRQVASNLRQLTPAMRNYLRHELESTRRTVMADTNALRREVRVKEADLAETQEMLNSKMRQLDDIEQSLRHIT